MRGDDDDARSLSTASVPHQICNTSARDVTRHGRGRVVQEAFIST